MSNSTTSSSFEYTFFIDKKTLCIKQICTVIPAQI
uniref:Uncharacterized protein n=1 Tax=Anguilla anguilla TaxID=7936 RepID=A0A0E9RVQ5_ANGAN